MNVHRRLAIVLGLLGAGCDGEQGPPGEQGAQGPQGIQGEQGPIGLQGPQGDPGDTRVQTVTGTCNTIIGTFSCEVTCPGTGAIAIAYAGWSDSPDQGSTLYLIDHGQDPLAPEKWTFDFGTEGAAADVPITMSVVCFTPPP